METLARAANRGSISTGYDIDNSLKFEPDNSEYLKATNTFAYTTPTSNQKGTISFWIKRTEIGNGVSGKQMYIFASSSGNRYANLGFDEFDNLTVYSGDSSWNNVSPYTYNKFRDTSAWYHIVIRYDTTDSTASNRLRVYSNGTEVSWVVAPNITQNGAMTYSDMNGPTWHSWGTIYAYFTPEKFFAGYLAEAHFVDGQSLAPTEFGEYDSTSGIWKPKAYTGTYGNCGYYLDFADSGNLGDDESGNGFDFDENNITSADQATDTPTNNFAVCTSIAEPTSSSMVFSDGKTKVTTSAGGLIQYDANFSWFPTILPAYNKGKWYVEAKIIDGAGGCVFGVCPNLGALDAANANPARYIVNRPYNTRIQTNLSGTADTTSYTNWFTYSNNDICTVALDAENQRVTFGKNGDWMDSSGGLTNSTPTYWISYSSGDWADYGGFVGVYGSESTTNGNPDWEVNFGGYTSFSISSANSDGNGYGTFEYAVPSGFYAICTKNLAEYG